VFVEFENAAPNSIFSQKKKGSPDCSPRFEHGFSQLLDWFYKIDTNRHAPDFEQRFGSRVVKIGGILVVGRREVLGPQEQDRLQWRQQHVAINGLQISCMTFDDLCEDMLLRLATYPVLKKARKTAGPTASKKTPRSK
jgi:hypothetical protein